MEIIKLAAIAVVTAVLATVLKQYKPEYRMLISIAAGTLIFAAVLGELGGLLTQLEAIMAGVDLPEEYLQILIKALGICFICQIACDSCKDAGESSLAGKIEMAGKISVLALAMPLMKNLLTIAGSLFEF